MACVVEELPTAPKNQINKTQFSWVLFMQCPDQRQNLGKLLNRDNFD